MLWLYDALPHGGERLSHCATVPSTSHLLAALTRLPATILARMKNIRCIYAFWFSIACLVMKKSIPLYVHFLFGDTKLKAKHVVPHQFAASHPWRQKLDAIGLTGYSEGFCQAQLSLIFLGGGGNIKPLSHCIFSLKNVFCNIQIAEAWCEF